MTLFWIILVNLVISLLSLAGIVIFAFKKKTSKKITNIFVSFSAGVLLASALLGMLKESLHEADIDMALMFVLSGMILGFMMERLLLWYHHHHEETHNLKPTAFLVLFGDGVHNFIDGVAIAAAFIASPIIGITTSIAIAAHELPQEFADLMILLHSGMKKKKAMLFNFISALTAVLGGVLGYYFLQSFTGMLPLVLAFTAGLFIYIAAADLIPELHEDHQHSPSFLQIAPFLIGIIFIYLITSAFGHSFIPPCNFVH